MSEYGNEYASAPTEAGPTESVESIGTSGEYGAESGYSLSAPGESSPNVTAEERLVYEEMEYEEAEYEQVAYEEMAYEREMAASGESPFEERPSTLTESAEVAAPVQSSEAGSAAAQEEYRAPRSRPRSER